MSRSNARTAAMELQETVQFWNNTYSPGQKVRFWPEHKIGLGFCSCTLTNAKAENGEAVVYVHSCLAPIPLSRIEPIKEMEVQHALV